MPPQPFTTKGTRGVFHLRRAVNNPRRLLKRLGVKLVESSQDAFASQRLGDRFWPEQYPDQPEPFLNVAGAVGDLNRRGRIRDQLFRRRAALFDTGSLFRSVKERVVDDRTVQVGSIHPAASQHQYGGETEQPVTDRTRKALAAEMRKYRKKTKEAARIHGTSARRLKRLAREGTVFSGGVGRAVALEKLGFLFQVDSVTTNINARPFVGITDQVGEALVRVVEEFFQEAADGGAAGA